MILPAWSIHKPAFQAAFLSSEIRLRGWPGMLFQRPVNRRGRRLHFLLAINKAVQ